MLQRPMSLQQEADKERLKFIIRLEQSDKVSVSDWENQFISTHVGKAYVAFSHKQREIVDKMIERYGARIGWE